MDEKNPQSLCVAALQLDIQWLEKRSNLERIDNLTQNLSSIDLLLLPETFSTGFAIDLDCAEPQEKGMVVDWMIAKAKCLDCVVAGSVLVDIGGLKSNRFYWVWPNGKVEFYDKRHLFRLGNEQDYVKAGNIRQVFEIGQFKILPNVCYDLRFPVWQRNVGDYDLLVNVANWPDMRRDAWDTLLKARAIENQCFVIGVNRVGYDGKQIPHSGGTVILDFKGDAMEAAEDNCEMLLLAELKLSELHRFKRKFPFYKDADNFIIK